MASTFWYNPDLATIFKGIINAFLYEHKFLGEVIRLEIIKYDQVNIMNIQRPVLFLITL